MILQALKEYYDRKAADPESDIPSDGFEQKPIPFLIVIDRNGKFINLDDTREPDGSRMVAKTFLVPRSRPRSGSRSYETTFLLWDHIGYVLQYPGDEKAKNQHSVWLKTLKELPVKLKEEINFQAIIKFYDSGGIAEVMSHPAWEDCKRISSCNITFKFAGEIMPVPCCQAVKDYISDTNDSNDFVRVANDKKSIGTCLISGEIDEIVPVHSDTRINKDAKKLVGFQKNSGFDSYGKEQGYNAPIGKAAEFAYTTALNILLRSKSRMQIGDAVTVCWSEEKSDLENQMPNFFKEPPKDDPDAGVKAVESLFNSIKNGILLTDENEKNKFYVLGLSPNVARIAIRFWIVDTVANMAVKIQQHFQDTEIISPQNSKNDWPKWLTLNALLAATANETKYDNSKSNLVYYRGKYFDVKPNLAGETARAILEGHPYPQTILQAAIRRIRAEHQITYPRAAMIKAIINRSTRFKNPHIKEELQMSLDENNINIGYRLGRLFATLEKIQQEANRGINATIRDRFYGAASGTPSAVFGNLMRLKNHHLAKIENIGRRNFFEKLLGQIIDGIDAKISFPAHLNLDDQARFAIGYYHQMQKFFTK